MACTALQLLPIFNLSLQLPQYHGTIRVTNFVAAIKRNTTCNNATLFDGFYTYL